MRAEKARRRPNYTIIFLLFCFWVWSCNQQVTIRDTSTKLSERLPESSSFWLSQDLDFTWSTWDRALEVSQKKDIPLLYYVAAPGCDGLLKNPSLLLRSLIEKNFVSVRVDPFTHPDRADHLLVAGCPALINALPDGRVFARAIDIPTDKVEQYLLRMDVAFKKRKKTLIDKVTEQPKSCLTKYSISELQLYLMASVDSKDKGLFGPQKFFHAAALTFLRQTGDSEAIAFVEDTIEVLLASPLWEDGSFRLFSYSPDWQHPAPERDLFDQAEIIGLLIEMEHWGLIEKWISYVNQSIADPESGALHGRQLQSANGEWWTDPNIYVDRMASSLIRLIDLSEIMDSVLARRLAAKGIDYIVGKCVDDSGSVSHVCNAEGATNLLKDQALVAIALSNWSKKSSNGSLMQLANKIIQAGNEKKNMNLGDEGLVYLAYWHWNYGEQSRAKQIINEARYRSNDVRQAALWGLLNLHMGQSKL